MEAKRTGNIRRVRLNRRYHDRRDEGERRQPPNSDQIKKILVTGDRKWDDIPMIHETLRVYPPGTILINGACHGADIICAAVAEALGFEVRNYPADWVKHRKAAGPIRNQQMLDKEHLPESPIDVCLAFHNDITNSRGTADMLKRVTKANIPWKLHVTAVTDVKTPQKV